MAGVRYPYRFSVLRRQSGTAPHDSFTTFLIHWQLALVTLILRISLQACVTPSLTMFALMEFLSQADAFALLRRFAVCTGFRDLKLASHRAEKGGLCLPPSCNATLTSRGRLSSGFAAFQDMQVCCSLAVTVPSQGQTGTRAKLETVRLK